jgi:ribosomal protein S11
MWIGTTEGLVVLYSPQNVFQPGKNFDAQPVLFEEDGVVQRLLGTEAVNAVVVDGANKKWFGTLNSGVFYTSADGTETIYNFTVDNSPLLSNTILDIAIDDETGEVYFATAEGIVSYRGSATRGYDDYTDVYAYPNPVRPGYDGPIYIRGLVTNARVKITDVAGNIVFETIAEGGQARWDGLNLDGEKVVSGVYVAYITDDLAEKTTVTKILVIR